MIKLYIHIYLQTKNILSVLSKEISHACYKFETTDIYLSWKVVYFLLAKKKKNVCNIPIEKGKDGERELQREKRMKKRKRKRMRRYQEKKENGKIKWKERERIGR